MKNYLQKSNNAFPSFFDVFGDFLSPEYYDGNGNIKTDIRETENGYELEAELCGFDKKDIAVELNDGYLTISAEKEEKEEDKDKKYIKRERCVSFKRSFYVGDIDETQISAKYENGLLKLEIPKEPNKKDKNRRIEIV